MGRASREKRRRRVQAHSRPDALPREPTASRPADEGLAITAVSLCFLLSGFAALLYQTAWLRQFSIVFGTSELAVATVLAAYMGGLAAGAAAAERLIHRIRRPVLVYGVLELGIAAAALAVPLLLAGASSLFAAALGGQAEPPDSDGWTQPVFYLVTTFLILAIPTGLMGATLPLLTRHVVRTDEQVGPRVALLYTINTAGAVLGTLTAAFLLLPRVGLLATVVVGVIANAAVFLVAVLLARNLTPSAALVSADENAQTRLPGLWQGVIRPLADGTRPLRARLAAAFRDQTAWILPLMLLSGAVAFSYEVLWTRLLNHVLGGTVYAFATMLASFLTGIAIGGAIGGRIGADRRRAVPAFAVSQFMIAGLSAGIYLWLSGFVPDAAGLAANAAVAMGVMLPATLFIGATFPLAVRIFADGPKQASQATARVYAWNTAGAISGAIVAGFLIIPWLGFAGSVRLNIAINLLLGTAALLLMSRMRLQLGFVATAAAMLAVFLYQPGKPMALIDTSVIDADRGGRTLYYSVGRSATVFLKEREGTFYLRTNGLPEASMEPRGTPPMMHDQKWLTALPAVARPDAESMMIVGFGGGVAIEGAPPGIREIDVVELEPEVIAANRTIADRRRYDPLGDPRVNVVINDARNALTLTDKSYDIIVSQPSHPWTAGASHLYTLEFLQLARRRLASDGVFVQWINSTFVDEALLRSLAATLTGEFRHVRLYQPSVTVLLFLASDAPLDIEQQVSRTGQPLRDDLVHFSGLGMNAAEDLVVALSLDDSGVRRLGAGAPPSTDDDNQMAMRSRPAGDGLSPAELTGLLAADDPLLDRNSWIFASLGDRLDFAYIGSRLITTGMEERARRLSETVPDEATGFLIRGLGLRHRGRLEEAGQAFALALDRNPADTRAAYALIRRHLPALATDGAPAGIAAIARRLTGPAGAIVEGWRYGIERDWVALAGLDPALRRAEPTDIWYVEAAKLRAEWRTKVDAGPRTDELNREAQRIVDRALIISRTTDLLILRAATAIRLGDPAAFVETARYVMEHYRSQVERAERGEYVLTVRERRTMRARLQGFVRELDGDLAAQAGGRAAEVRRQFEAVLRRVDNLAPTDS